MYKVYQKEVFRHLRITINGDFTDVLISKYPMGQVENGHYSLSILFPIVHQEGDFMGTLLLSDTFLFDTEEEMEQEWNNLEEKKITEICEEKLKEFSF